MLENGGAFGLIFGIIGTAVAGAGAVLGVVVAGRTASLRRTLTHGLPATARCMETYVVHNHSGARPDLLHSGGHRQVVLGFRTRDGGDIRIMDPSGVPRLVGDFVEVRYLPDRPYRAVVVGTDPSRRALTVAAGMFVCVMLVSVGLLFATSGFWLFRSGSDAPDHFPGISPASSPGVPDPPGIPCPFDACTDLRLP